MESKLMPCGWEPAVYEAKRKTDVDGDHYYYIKKSNEQTGGTPMTNEPTTGEIVRAIRLCEEGEINCTKCPFANKSCGDLNLLAADRLESQAKENEISRHLIEMQSNVITELTARAESAERERDAAIDAIADIKENGFCGSCKGCNAPYVGQEKITFCYGWEWRGLQPQDGGMK